VRQVVGLLLLLLLVLVLTFLILHLVASLLVNGFRQDLVEDLLRIRRGSKLLNLLLVLHAMLRLLLGLGLSGLDAFMALLLHLQDVFLVLLLLGLLLVSLGHAVHLGSRVCDHTLAVVEL
jgi:hypothetical protein